MRKQLMLLVSVAIIGCAIAGMWGLKGDTYAWQLVFLAVIAFIQNMAFTAVSRSRNAADPDYHRICAWFSNGIWYLCYMTILSAIWSDVKRLWDGITLAGSFDPRSFIAVMLVFVVYSAATAEGSVLMMKIALRSEKGRRRVGARVK